MCITVEKLSVGYSRKTVVSDISMELCEGQVMAVLGANGSGKTTFFRTLMGILPPVDGKVYVDGKNIFNLARKKMGKMIAYVPQNHNCTFSFSVKDVVVMGRNPFLKAHQEPSIEDYNIVDEVLESLNISYLAPRMFKKLSGGEKKLVLIARALVQKPKLLIMDEPTSDLDIGNTVTVLEQIARLKEDKMSIIINTHSPKEAKVYADKILMIKEGKIFKYGKAELLDSASVMNELYSLDMDELSKKMHGFIREIA